MTTNQYAFTGPIGTTVTKGLVPGAATTNGPSTFQAGLSQLSSSIRSASTAAATYTIIRVPAAAVGKVHAVSWQFRIPGASISPTQGTLGAFLNSGGTTRLRLEFNPAGYLMLAGQTSLVPTGQPLKTPGGANFTPSKDTIYTARLSVTATTFNARITDATDTTTVASVAYTLASALTEDQAFFEVGAAGAGDGALIDNGELVVTDLSTEAPRYNPGANALPAVTAGGAQTVTPGTTVALTSTATDSDGTIAARQWTVSSILPTGTASPTITNPNAASATFTPTVPGVYRLLHTATDDKGATGTATTVVYVQHTADTGWPVIDVVATGWTVNGSASSTAAALNDTDASTGITSPAATSTATLTMAPITPRTALQISVGVAVDVAPASGETFSLSLMDGATTRKTQTFTPTTGQGTATLTADSTVCSAISTDGWNGLKVVINHGVA